jgi:uncharacterized protein with PIN domain
MIVVDSSALIAVLFEEPEKQAFQDIIDGDERCVLSAVNAHETACVLRGRLGVVAVAEFWQWLADNEVEVVPFDEVQVRAAAAAFDRYGKGNAVRALGFAVGRGGQRTQSPRRKRASGKRQASGGDQGTAGRTRCGKSRQR